MYLLRVSFCVRQLGGHMKHNLLIMETRVDGLYPRLTMSDIQPTTKPAEERRQRGNEGRLKSTRKKNDRRQRQDWKKRSENAEQRCVKVRHKSAQSAHNIHARPSLNSCQGHSCPLHHNVIHTANSRALQIVFLGIHVESSLINSRVGDAWFKPDTIWSMTAANDQKNVSVWEREVYKPFKVMKLNLMAQELQELHKGRTFFHVPKQLFLWSLQGGGERDFQEEWYETSSA